MSRNINIDLTHLPKYILHPYKTLMGDTHRYKVIKGSAASGKSYWAAQYIVYQAIMHPRRILIARKVYKTNKDSTFKQIVEVIEALGLQKIFTYSDARQSEPYIKCITGAEIIFTGLDNAEKLKSIASIDMVWVEEATEITEADFNQLDLRLRANVPYHKCILLTFNPIDASHWIKKRFFDTSSDDTVTLETTYKDNPYLDKYTIQSMESLRDTDPYMYQVYCLGHWGTPGGSSIFNNTVIHTRLQDCKPPLAKGTIVNNTFTPDPAGYISIYQLPDYTHPYLMSVDTKSTGSDYWAVHILDNSTGIQVATMHVSKIEEAEAVQQICSFGLMYHAPIIVEVNHSTYPSNKLKEMSYPYGIEEFRTGANRPAMISTLKEYIHSNPQCINDKETLNECLTFVRDKTGKPCASPGNHDDLIMSLAILIYRRNNYNTSASPVDPRIPIRHFKLQTDGNDLDDFVSEINNW